jgi:hypothetical protein
MGRCEPDAEPAESFVAAPNKRFEFAPDGRRTRKSDALLLAAQAIRSAVR